MNRWLLPAILALVLTTAACAEPPNKEMDQAQGAIDAARAAGADKYAATTFTAAVASLQRSHDAVAQGDYRLALDTALAGREQAQTAAREAADTKARLRGEAERTMAEVATRLAEANGRVAAAEKARVPRRVLMPMQEALAVINGEVQKAGEAIRAGDYLEAQPVLAAAKDRIDKVLADLDARPTSQPQRRRS